MSSLNKSWDIVIVGAGPAGSFAAYLLAQRSLRILLVDKAQFPRAKVCGCCINGAAINLLAANSLQNLLADEGAVQLNDVCLYDGKRKAKLPLHGSYSLSRNRFDTALVDAAVASGAVFLPNTIAQVLHCGDGARVVQLQTEQTTHEIQAKLVLVADGLSGKSLGQHSEFGFVTHPDSRFGCGTILDKAPDYYQNGQIYMACAAGGYVGLVRLEDGRVDVAAALDRAFCRSYGGPALAAANILRSCFLPVPPSLEGAAWTGTEPLTRNRKRIAAERIFVIGDACGYAEPLTGEGIAWALTSAAGVADLATAATTCWSNTFVESWHTEHKRLLQSRQKRSFSIACGLRSDVIRHLALPLISSFPAIASSIISHIANPKIQAGTS